MRHFLTLFFAAALFLVGFLPGCDKDTSEEQKQADTLLTGAKATLSRGEYHVARALFFSALRCEEALGRTARIAEIQRILGDMDVATAGFDSALVFYSRAAKSYHSIANRQAVGELTLESALVYRVIGDERRAYNLYTEALRLARVFNDTEGVHDVEWAILPACRALDEREEENRVLADLMKDYSAASDIDHQAKVHFEYGLSNFSRKEYDRAAQSFLQAFSLADQSRDSLFGVTSLLRLAMAFDAQHNVRESVLSYGDALKRVEKLRGASGLRFELLTRIGNLYLRGHQPEEGRRFYRAAVPAAINAGNMVGEGYLLIQLGHCDLENTRDAALKSYRSALELFKNASYPAGIAYAYLSIGSALRKSNQIAEAVDALKMSMQQAESVLLQPAPDDLFADCETSFFSSGKGAVYDELADVLLQTGRYDEAYWYIERKNSSEMFRVLSLLDPARSNAMLTPSLVEFQHLRALQIGAERRLGQALMSGPRHRELLDDVWETLARTSGILAEKGSFIVQTDPALASWVKVSSIGLPDVQRHLAPGTALVQYFAGKRSLFAFVVTNAKSVVQMAAVDRERLAGMMNEFGRVLRQHEVQADTGKAQRVRPDPRLQELTRLLSEAFIRPIANEIQAIPTLLVTLPPGVPWLPLHALRQSVLPASPYVAEQHLVSYLPTAGVLLFDHPPPPPVRDVVGMGFAGSSSWDVEYELRDIRAFYKEARLYFNEQATVTALQKEYGDVLHLTAEVECTDQMPGNAHIVLSDGRSIASSAKIPMGELFSLPPFSTVIISNISNSTNALSASLPYILLANGTGAVIGNGFTPSRKTKKFFGEVFYTALLGGNSAQSAYRKVQLEMIRNPDYAPQFVWAPFFLWGK